MAKDKSIHVVITADGKQYSASINQATGELQQFGNQSRKTQADVSLLSGAIKILAGSYAAIKLKQLITESTLLAARAETLGVVLESVGRNAGYSKSQVDAVAESVRQMGITTNVARRIVVRMIQAQLDLDKASQLARAAQDAAVIGNINSSEALDRLLHGIVTLQPEILRTVGITVTFEHEYEKLAETTGRTVNSLTQAEKKQIALNAVLREAASISGTYEGAMETAGKQAGSLQREQEELAREMGELLLPAYTALIKETRSATGALLEMAGDDKVPTFFNWLADQVFYIGGAMRAFGVEAGLLASVLDPSNFGSGFFDKIDALLNVRRQMIDEIKAEVETNRALIRVGAENLDFRGPAAFRPSRVPTDPGGSGAGAADKAAKKYAQAELALQRQIKLVGEVSQAERTRFEVSLGALKDLEPLEKQKLIRLAEEADRVHAIQEQREAELALRDDLIKQEQEAIEERRKAAKQGLAVIRETVATEVELVDRKYEKLHNNLLEAQRFERITIEEFNALKAQLENEHQREIEEIRKRVFEKTKDEGTEAFKELSQAVKGWGRDFADTLIESERGFSGFIDGVVREFQRIAIAKATDPLFSAFEKFLTMSMSGLPATHGAQFTGTGFEGLFSSGSFAGGGSFTVGGPSGIDRTLVAFNATRGERVTVDRPGEQSAGGANVTVVMENRGTPQRVSGSNVSFDASGMVVRIIKEDIQAGGGISGALESTYGMRRLGG